MSFSISSLKHGGAGHLKLSDNPRESLHTARCPVVPSFCRGMFSRAGLCLFIALAAPAEPISSPSANTVAAAERCRLKIKGLEKFSASAEFGQKQSTRFSEEEVNAYLEVDLRPGYHPSLKNLQIRFERNRLQAETVIDFDRLGSTPDYPVQGILGALFSGIHTLSAQGQLVSGNGKAYFKLDRARFDESILPGFLVEQIITAVGKSQDPPFNPLEPSQIPYKIESVDVFSGYIMVYQ